MNAPSNNAILWAERCLLRTPVLYTRGIDRRDWDLVRSCFADDAYVAGSRDTAAFADYFPTLRTGVEYFPSTMHFVGNQIAEVNNDAKSGWVETYAVAYHWRGDSPGAEHPENLVMGVRYQDEIAEFSGRWLITRRTVSADWYRGSFPAPN
ncbi:nuclear transport factor 2 family protein [Rhodococcus sp. IEGM 1366]|uniref:nuclear transport factor 2 family protein n=1 Tax=Rhodococcus sp. IEGM 1366 TaxID=3082223 RepID=UPI0029543C8F|nr:nuclear transport factor 2 family protein [Rhodococcus sp. IEGM 1366]MDV8071004.1 nuclear transport factor 2 family protein [Rhodococcus sp. IEGM 1366]